MLKEIYNELLKSGELLIMFPTLKGLLLCRLPPSDSNMMPDISAANTWEKAGSRNAMKWSLSIQAASMPAK
jgi:hypothetical protein